MQITLSTGADLSFANLFRTKRPVEVSTALQ